MKAASQAASVSAAAATSVCSTCPISEVKAMP